MGKKQNRKVIYGKKKTYAKSITKSLLNYEVFSTSSLMINKNSGFDIKYQINKVHNLKLAANVLNQLVIKPNETFSFWQIVRCADRQQAYKDGLNLVDGKIVGSYGGGLCQLSNMLFWMFLHTPMTIIERHGHAVESFSSSTEDLPYGNRCNNTRGMVTRPISLLRWTVLKKEKGD